MAVFPDPASSVEAARTALAAGASVDADGYDTCLRAGLHYGTPQAIGSDYIGVDVNIAARLCEAAAANEVLVSEAVQRRLDGDARKLDRRTIEELDGVPTALQTYALTVDPG
jgi:adenylate cyclase